MIACLSSRANLGKRQVAVFMLAGRGRDRSWQMTVPARHASRSLYWLWVLLRIIALIAMVAASTAQAADTTLTLACKQ